MIKYIPKDTQVVFSEIPDEISLAINISNCPHHCPGCHSPYLRENIGEVLYGETLIKLITENEGVTCVLFMGEGKDEEALFNLVDLLRHFYGKSIKIGLYTGGNDVSPFLWENLDYIKLGPYIEERGPLNKETTNQRLYKRTSRGYPDLVLVNGKWRAPWIDITYRFWRKGTE
jgi:anaerobic ribonucleoside-triphosphate reductase activating protein